MKGKPGAGISLLFTKSTKKTARLNFPIRRTDHYQKYIRLPIIGTAEELEISPSYILNRN
jgi:hypothetical protein